MTRTPLREKLRDVFQRLNEFIEKYNEESTEEGGISIPPQEIRIVGQVALLLADLPFPVLATTDLDNLTTLPFNVQKELNKLLFDFEMHLVPDGPKVWMPPDTPYLPLFDFKKVKVLYADPESVILSKAKFNRVKDRPLIEKFLRYFPNVKEKIKKI